MRHIDETVKACLNWPHGTIPLEQFCYLEFPPGLGMPIIELPTLVLLRRDFRRTMVMFPRSWQSQRGLGAPLCSSNCCTGVESMAIPRTSAAIALPTSVATSRAIRSTILLVLELYVLLQLLELYVRLRSRDSRERERPQLSIRITNMSHDCLFHFSILRCASRRRGAHPTSWAHCRNCGVQGALRKSRISPKRSPPRLS